MSEIKFSVDYPKLHGQKTATLLHVDSFPVKQLHADMVKLDTDKGDGTFYQLHNGTALVLVFLGDKLIPFTTIRSYGANKLMKFEKLIGQKFDIVIENSGDKENPVKQSPQEVLPI